jgi:GNAT superfamily N-acetyltransferase
VTVTVRALGPEDWPLYRSVRLAALGDAPYAFASTVKGESAFTPQRWQKRLRERLNFIAEEDGTVYGLIGVTSTEPGTAKLVSMWVHPDARGRGVGDLLVRQVLRWARGHGFATVHLWVYEGNDHAERLYARHGFQRTGAAQPVRGKPGVMELGMACQLHP